MGDPASAPRLSAVLVAALQRRRAARALRSLLRQDLHPEMEILFLDLAPPELAPPDEALLPGVRHVRLSPAATFAEARAEGVRLARGDAVAFMEEHCVALPGWARALSSALERGWSGAGVEIVPAPARTRRERALRLITLVNYAPWIPPAAPGEAAMLPGHNSAYRRAALLGLGERLPFFLTCDMVLQRELVRRGHRLGIEPAAKIRHMDETSLLEAARGIYRYHVAQAVARSETGGWSAARRALVAILAPALPFYRSAKTLAFFARRRPAWLPRILLSLPRLLAHHAICAAGQARGLLFGLGDTQAAFTRYEISGPRVLDDCEEIPSDERG